VTYRPRLALAACAAALPLGLDGEAAWRVRLQIQFRLADASSMSPRSQSDAMAPPWGGHRTR
jgi:hypothetical protein